MRSRFIICLMSLISFGLNGLLNSASVNSSNLQIRHQSDANSSALRGGENGLIDNDHANAGDNAIADLADAVNSEIVDHEMPLVNTLAGPLSISDNDSNDTANNQFFLGLNPENAVSIIGNTVRTVFANTGTAIVTNMGASNDFSEDDNENANINNNLLTGSGTNIK